MSAVATPVRRALPRLAEATGVVVCMATGPSMTAEDVDYVRGKATVVVVNDAHRLAPWAEVLYSSDRYWWAHHKAVPSFAGLRATIEYSPGRYAAELLKVAPEMHFLRNTGHDGIETHPDGIRTGRQNSGGAAVNVAVHLGATRIVLLGYDCGATTGKRHFFGDHPSPLSNNHNYPTWRLGFDQMAAPLLRLGVSVVNCTPVTSISAFPCAPLRDTL